LSEKDGLRLALHIGMRKSIAELHAAGVTFEAHEAVAVAQQLISSLRDQPDMGMARPPYGPPCAKTVFLHDDGNVTCSGCVATPVVSEVGIVLEEMLPGGSLRVPGGLRYTIARALLNVDVPPFGSLDEFARDLARHEKGDRQSAVRAVLARAPGIRALTRPVPADRRRMNESATQLRRALREADARIYEQQLATPVYDVNVPPQGRCVPAAAACLAAGLMLICTGEFMHRRQQPIAVAQTAPISSAATAADASRELTTAPAPAVADVAPAVAPAQVDAAPDRGIIAVREIPPFARAAARPEPRRVSTKKPAKVTTMATVRRQPSRSSQKGVLDKLKLQWLKKAFTVHSDL
jgi:hypothetical protein